MIVFNRISPLTGQFAFSFHYNSFFFVSVAALSLPISIENGKALLAKTILLFHRYVCVCVVLLTLKKSIVEPDISVPYCTSV